VYSTIIVAELVLTATTSQLPWLVGVNLSVVWAVCTLRIQLSNENGIPPVELLKVQAMKLDSGITQNDAIPFVTLTPIAKLSVLETPRSVRE